MTGKLLCALLMLFLLTVVQSCSGPVPESISGSEKVRVFVSIMPQAYFVERVGGARVDVTVLVAEGQSPHSYEPTPRQMAALSNARVYFLSGVPFEKRLIEKISTTYKNIRISDTRKGIELSTIEEGHGLDEKSHDEAEELDPHVWLDPKNAKIQAAAICEELVALDPDHKSEYEENLQSLNGELEEIDEKTADALAPFKGREFFVFHPAFGYFARAYGLKQTAVETGGKEPGAKAVATLIRKARAEGVRIIFVQPQFSSKSAETIASAIGGAVVKIDPLAKDYIKNFENIAEEIEAAFGQSRAMPKGK